MDVVKYFPEFFSAIEQSGLNKFHQHFIDALEIRYQPHMHGDFSSWQEALDALPPIDIETSLFDQPIVSAQSKTGLPAKTKQQLTNALMQLHPWRKGPFQIADVFIDTEWRSDWKWQRIAPYLDLQNKNILDVGCGNGYYLYRMMGSGARMALGVDPSLKFIMQFKAIQHYLQSTDISQPMILPLRGEDLPANMQYFDTVFSMGVLYHRKSPFEHLQELAQCLKPKGQLVLETLVVEGGDKTTVLVPEDRYAQMSNVWCLPSTEALCVWLKKTGFSDVQVIDVSTTTVEEQRKTDWMQFHSLSEFLDPDNPQKTIEGHPAPVRATIIARR